MEGCFRGKTGPIIVDLQKKETFPEFLRWDLIINCADSLTAPPEKAIVFALEQGAVWVETASEPQGIARILQATQGVSAKGSVLLGAGIFTGLSNMLGGEAAKLSDPCEKIELGIRWSILSGGGGGMVNLVGHTISIPTLFYQNGKAEYGPSVGNGPILPFYSGEYRTFSAPFSETAMLFASTQVPNICTYMAPIPSFLSPFFSLTPLLQNALMRWVLWLEFTFIRRFLLKNHPSTVEITALGFSPGKNPIRLGLFTSNGMELAGIAAAAMIAEFEVKPGLWMPDQVLHLEKVKKRICDLGGEVVWVTSE